MTTKVAELTFERIVEIFYRVEMDNADPAGDVHLELLAGLLREGAAAPIVDGIHELMVSARQQSDRVDYVTVSCLVGSLKPMLESDDWSTGVEWLEPNDIGNDARLLRSLCRVYRKLGEGDQARLRAVERRLGLIVRALRLDQRLVTADAHLEQGIVSALWGELDADKLERYLDWLERKLGPCDDQAEPTPESIERARQREPPEDPKHELLAEQRQIAKALAGPFWIDDLC